MSALLLDLSLGLTSGPDPEIEKIQSHTWAGQAHWAVGPDTCRTCAHWDDLDRRNKKSNIERACAMHAALMRGEIGPRVPGYALACRHHELSAEAREQRAIADTCCKKGRTS